jgi:2-polyprenyl-3-methyl-5-hydroxy-6-metoxy-1,4-benzoquinol methylase
MSLLRSIIFNIRYIFQRAPWDSGITPPELMTFLESCPRGRAIDLGCGTGTNVITLAQKGWTVTGIDFAPQAIQIAKRKASAANASVDLRVGDVTNLKDVTGQFDLALDLGCFHGVDDHNAYLRELDRILAPNGYWFLYVIFKTEQGHSRTNITADEMNHLWAGTKPAPTLIQRIDGQDRGDRKSAYFIFQKQS